jgi:hypothetical protein
MISIQKQPVPDHRNRLSLTMSVRAFVHWMIPSAWKLLILFLVFFGNVSHSSAQTMNFRSEQKIQNGQRAVSLKMALPALQLNSDSLQSSATPWSEPIMLFQTAGNESIHAPFVVSDSHGNVHAFWTVLTADKSKYDTIYYTRLDAIGWTTPVDIIATDLLGSVSATIGHDDSIYLIWNEMGGITYSKAPIQGAEFVQNWSRSVLITDANFYSDLSTASSGRIYLAYPGKNTSGVFEQFLEPNDPSWSSARMISQTSLTNSASDYVQMGVSENGTLHVVWTEFFYPESWPPRGNFYSRSIDGGNTWSVPEMLAGDGFDQINISVVDDNNIHVAWNGMAGVGGRYHRWSSDGGKTWSETVEVIPAGVGGTEGLPQLAVDQSGTLHMLTTYMGGCLWYTYLQNLTWTPPTCISGEMTLIEEPALTVTEGNRLHAIFWDNRKSIWYSTKVTNADWVTPRPMKYENELAQSTQVSGPTASTSLTITPTLRSTSLPVDQQLDAPPKFTLNPGQLLILSLSPVVVLIFLIVVFSYNKKNR